MKVSFQPWRNPLRPWRIDAPELYVLASTSRGATPDHPFWIMKLKRQGAFVWLMALEPIRVGIWEWKAVRYQICSSRPPYRDNAKLITPKLPPIWMARKRDVLMFKLTWAG